MFLELAKLCPVPWVSVNRATRPWSSGNRATRPWSEGEILSVLRRMRSIDAALLHSSDVLRFLLLRFIRRSENPFIRKRAIELLQTFPNSDEYLQPVVEEAMRVLDELDFYGNAFAYVLRTSFMQATGFRRIEYAAALASEDIWWMLLEIRSDSPGGSVFDLANLR